MTALAELKIGMHGRAISGLKAKPPEGCPPRGGAACGQAPEFGGLRLGSGQALSSFAVYKLDFLESDDPSTEKIRTTEVTVSYAG